MDVCCQIDRTSAVGRAESAALTGTGRSWRGTVGSRCDWPLFHGLLTFTAAPAAEVKGGLMAVSVSPPDRHDRPLTLHNGRSAAVETHAQWRS